MMPDESTNADEPATPSDAGSDSLKCRGVPLKRARKKRCSTVESRRKWWERMKLKGRAHSFRGKKVDLCHRRNLEEVDDGNGQCVRKGVISGRLIVDSNDLPLRKITDFRKVSMPRLKKDGTIHPTGRKEILWMETSNYTVITDEQKRLNDELGELIDKAKTLSKEMVRKEKPLEEFFDLMGKAYSMKRETPADIGVYDLRVSQWKALFLMYIKPMKKIPAWKSYLKDEWVVDNDVSLLLHRSPDFGRKFQSALCSPLIFENRDRDEVLKECLSRTMNVGATCHIGITTKPKGWGVYDVSIHFCSPCTEISLNAYDLSQTEDLTKELISDIFNESQVRKNKEFVEKIIANLEAWLKLRREIAGGNIVYGA